MKHNKTCKRKNTNTISSILYNLSRTIKKITQYNFVSENLVYMPSCKFENIQQWYKTNMYS